MALFRMTVTNKTNEGVVRGGRYFPPRVKDLEVETDNTRYAEIQACSNLEISGLEVTDEIADIAAVQPDKLGGQLIMADHDEAANQNHEGTETQGGGQASRSMEQRIVAAASAKQLARDKGVAIEEVARNVIPSGAGGRILRRDVESYLEGRSGSESQPEQEEEATEGNRQGLSADEGGEQGVNAQSERDEASVSNAEGSAADDAQDASNKAAEASEDAQRASDKAEAQDESQDAMQSRPSGG